MECYFPKTVLPGKLENESGFSKGRSYVRVKGVNPCVQELSRQLNNLEPGVEQRYNDRLTFCQDEPDSSKQHYTGCTLYFHTLYHAFTFI